MKVFVYGTLKVGGRFSEILDKYRVDAKKARVDGFDLLDLGWFPGAIVGNGYIYGEIHKYKNQEAVLKILDRIEGYDPRDRSNSLYTRQYVKVEMANGKTEDAIMYVFNRSVKHPKKIKSGVWEI